MIPPKENNKALISDLKEMKIYGMLRFKKMRIILPKNVYV